MITTQQLDHFHNYGFVVIENVLDPINDVQPIVDDYAKLLDRLGYSYVFRHFHPFLAPGRYVLRVEAETLLTDGGKAKREVEFRVR